MLCAYCSVSPPSLSALAVKGLKDSLTANEFGGPDFGESRPHIDGTNRGTLHFRIISSLLPTVGRHRLTGQRHKGKEWHSSTDKFVKQFLAPRRKPSEVPRKVSEKLLPKISIVVCLHSQSGGFGRRH